MLDLDSPAKMRIPKETELTLVGEHVASYSDTDINMHVNNTNYPDILCGFLPTMKNKRAIKVTINYIHEAPLDDTIKIYASKEDEDGAVFFRTVRQDGEINIESEIIFEDYRQ